LLHHTLPRPPCWDFKWGSVTSSIMQFITSSSTTALLYTVSMFATESSGGGQELIWKSQNTYCNLYPDSLLN
jgi:hypothetical protein